VGDWPTCCLAGRNPIQRRRGRRRAHDADSFFRPSSVGAILMALLCSAASVRSRHFAGPSRSPETLNTTQPSDNLRADRSVHVAGGGAMMRRQAPFVGLSDGPGLFRQSATPPCESAARCSARSCRCASDDASSSSTDLTCAHPDQTNFVQLGPDSGPVGGLAPFDRLRFSPGGVGLTAVTVRARLSVDWLDANLGQCGWGGGRPRLVLFGSSGTTAQPRGSSAEGQMSDISRTVDFRRCSEEHSTADMMPIHPRHVPGRALISRMTVGVLPLRIADDARRTTAPNTPNASASGRRRHGDHVATPSAGCAVFLRDRLDVRRFGRVEDVIARRTTLPQGQRSLVSRSRPRE